MQAKKSLQTLLRPINREKQYRPMFSAGNNHIWHADRAGGLALGGIGGMHLAAMKTGVTGEIDEKIRLCERYPRVLPLVQARILYL